MTSHTPRRSVNKGLATCRLIKSGQPLMVSKSVLLEFEWVMRGYYGFAPAEVASVVRHVLEQGHITVEDREAVEQALSNFGAGIVDTLRSSRQAPRPATPGPSNTLPCA